MKNELTASSGNPLDPMAMLKEEGDTFVARVTKTGKKVARLDTKEVRATRVQHKSGKGVTYLCSPRQD